MLVDRFGWSLAELDATDIASLMPFVTHYPSYKEGAGTPTRKQAYCDEVGFL